MTARSLRRILATTTLAGVGALLLASCSVSANLTVDPDTVASAAADGLEETVGIRPEIDCGAEQIDLVENEEVLCELTDPSSGARFDTTVTITEVDGRDFKVHAQVADEPKS